MRLKRARALQGIAAAALAAIIAGGVPAAANEPAPLTGFPSCDYDNFEVSSVISGRNVATWSPDGSRLLDGAAILDAETGEEVDRVPFDAPVRRSVWSPDGNTIVFDTEKDNPSGAVSPVTGETNPATGEGLGSDLWAYDLATGRFSRLTQHIDGANYGPTFSRDGTRLAWIRAGVHGELHHTPMTADIARDPDGTIRLEREADLLPPDPDHPAHNAFTRVGEFTADDSGLVVLSMIENAGNSDAWAIDLETREWTNLTRTPYFEEHPRVSPNGQAISFTSTKDHLWTGNVVLDLSGAIGIPNDLDFVAIFAYAPFAQIPVFAISAEAYVANPDGSDIRSLTFGTENGIEGGWYSRPGNFSPDGTRMALGQRPVAQVRVEGMPPNTVQFPNSPLRATGTDAREPRLLLIDFACTPGGGSG